MILVYFLLWIIFNGRITLEIALFGVGIALLMDAFICKFMGYKINTSLKMMRNLLRGILFIFILLKEILKANIQVMRLILSAKYEIEPTIVHFKTGLKTEAARVALANCITLTPGTITITLQGDEYYVHCLDKELAEGIENSVFVRLLEKMEE